MTWPELLEHMDNLSEWGHGQLKGWGQQASQLQVAQKQSACLDADLQHRMEFQNKLAGVCVDMCKEVGAFPKCTYPDFVAPDSTPGVMSQDKSAFILQGNSRHIGSELCKRKRNQ